ncbi:MAG: carbamoyltransferase [Prochloron sp. SP5CPC1]|nr:carbamoyltransferase [Candidatus Paraprochloron terpiosi SP5CPC1]
MPTRILGISAFYHDSAAALLVDGKIVAAAQEERFSRKKHDYRFPQQAVAYCLAQGGIQPTDLDYVGFYDKPLTKFQRLVETYGAYAPASFRSYLKAMPLWLRNKLHIPSQIDRALNYGYRGRYIFAEHHESHAASAFFPSPFESAAILTLDGVGEWATASLGHGRGHKIAITQELRFPHSLGLLYSAFTYYTGFKVNSGEYKVMGLAPYGEPRFQDLILTHLIDLKEDGSFWLDMSYFNYCQGITMTNEKFHNLFGAPPRQRETALTQRDMDLAASIQVVCEEIALRCARHLHKLTGSPNLVMAGGVALNCVGNSRILRDGPFEQIWIQPAAGDAGGALGVALLIWHQLLGESRSCEEGDSMRGSFLGPAYTDREIRAFLDSQGAKYHIFDSEEALLELTVKLLIQEKVMGWFQHRMEFGPRSLGCRSIIGDPRSEKMQKVMNLKIKFRESFRPFAPSVLKEYASEYFDLPRGRDSPYMLLVSPIKADKRTANSEMKQPVGLEKLGIKRSVVPAVTHVDFSARLQTVEEEQNQRYYRLLKKFYEQTGCPMVVNTSFNIRGEPIVATPQDAYRCFMGTFMDALAMGNTILLKEEQPDHNSFDLEAYQSQFELD